MDKIWTLRTIYHSVLVVHNFHQSIQIADVCGKTAADSHHQAHHHCHYHCHGYSQKQLSTFLFIQIKQIKIIISILINFIIQKLFCIFLSHFAAYMWQGKLLSVIVLMLGVVMVECARSVIVLNLKQKATAAQVLLLVCKQCCIHHCADSTQAKQCTVITDAMCCIHGWYWLIVDARCWVFRW